MSEYSVDMEAVSRTAQVFVDIRHGALLERMGIAKLYDWDFIRQKRLPESGVLRDRFVANSLRAQQSDLEILAQETMHGVVEAALRQQKTLRLMGNLLTDSVVVPGEALLKTMEEQSLAIPDPSVAMTLVPERESID